MGVGVVMGTKAAACRVAYLVVLISGACWSLAPAAVPAVPSGPGVESPPPTPSANIEKTLEVASSLLSSKQPAKAVEVLLPAVERAHRLGDRAGEAAARSLRAAALQDLNRRDEAIQEWRSAEGAAALAGDTAARIRALGSAALLLARADKETEAEALVKQAVVLGTNESRRPLATAGALHDAGVAFYNNDRDAEAKELLEEAIAIRETRSPGSLELADSLDRLSMSLMELGDFSRAETLLQRSLEIREALAPNSAALAATLRGLGELGIRRDDLVTATALLDRSRAILEQTAPGSTALAAVYNRLGIVASTRRDSDVGESYFKQALAIFEKEDARSAAVANVLMNLGVTMRQRSDFASARDYYERALAIIQEIEPDGMTAAKLLGNLGRTLSNFGDLAAAEQYALKSQTILERIAPGSKSLCNTHWQLGSIASARSRYGDARSEYEKALAIVEKSSPGGDTEVSLRVRLGQVTAQAGDSREADAQLLRALTIAESVAGDRTAPLEEVLSVRAWVSAWRGDLPAAKADLLRWKGLKAARPAQSGFFFPDLHDLTTLGALLATTGDPTGGLEVLDRVQNTELKYVSLAISSLSEREALRFVAHSIIGLNSLVALASGPLAGDPVARRHAYDAVIRWRSGVLKEMASRRRTVSESSDPELTRLAGDVAEARRRLAKAAFDEEVPVYGEGAATEVSEAAAALDRAERALGARSRRLQGEVTRSQSGLEEVAPMLPQGSALVSYVHYFADPYAAADPMPPPSYAAFVLAAGAPAPEIVPLGPAAPIDALVAALREQVLVEASAPGRAPKRGEAAYRESATRLGQKIWDPLSGKLSGVRRVFVVMDGALNLVDLGTLPVGSRSYLVERRPAIDYLSAERDLVPQEDERAGSGLLVLGAADYDETELAEDLASQLAAGTATERAASPTLSFRGSRPACGDFRSLRFERLPASADESRTVAAMWNATATKPRNGSSAAISGPVTLLKGASASEVRFKLQAPGKQVLHLATHGFFLAEGCASVDPRGTPLPKTLGENPLLLSGLSLAGANRRDSAGPRDEDGILTAEEIAALDLTGVEWVVLSACDSGLGQATAGEGLFGLRRAFQIAGARTVVASLWPVEDRTALEWMTGLYHQRLTHGRSLSDAARLASTDLLRKRRSEGAGTHPFYWAGFVATGNGR